MSNLADTKPLTWRLRDDGQPVWLEEYEQKEGYLGLKKAYEMAPTDISKLVKDANLRGRGGAGFPAGIKWSLVPMGDDAPKDKYLICNADEMEPGTYKDRLMMEQLPHMLIEAMMIVGRAIQASRAYIFLRGEYVEAAVALNRAIDEAVAAGYVGDNILGTGFNLPLTVHTGAGRYICGEETALINSLEGRRANPRAKPPFPQIAGLFGKPTVVNNVETFVNIPAIIMKGVDWYQALGVSDDAGTKFYGCSGRVNKPGLWELPIGTTARELLEEHAGGMQPGLNLKCWLPGGASTDFLLPEHLDTPMDYGSIGKVGSRFGTGLMMAVDDQQNILSVVKNLEIFFARESCGWCTPCRDGIPWTVKLLDALEKGEGQPGDIETLIRHTRFLGPGKTHCAHAPGAMEPLQSAIKFFRDEFEAGIRTTAAAGSNAQQVG